MRRFAAVMVAALALAAPAAAFVPTDPFVPKQWYLADDHAFDAWPQPPTDLQPVRVAIIDSGIDAGHPEFAGKIALGRSFVGGSWGVDREGHGTFVAGIIAAAMDGQGIVGMAPSAQLLIAKVVRADGTIPLTAEAAAIRWAADNGAKVINLSLGGVRNPVDRTRDTYSALEAHAVAYAYAKGAVLVAAVGNADEAAVRPPYPYASYPAALPHVIGVSALTHGGDVAIFSNRDPIYNDISAPGQDIYSTFPRDLTAARPTCTDQGYSDCGPPDYRHPEGTSFAAPQVTAAAATLLAVRPDLTADQVSAVLEHSAVDVNAATGCPQCPLLRDRLSGWGRLDVANAVAALQGPLPTPDRYETNDDAGRDAHTVWGKTATLNATLDFYDDQVDVYRIALAAHERLTARLAGFSGANLGLVLWKPGTQRVEDLRSQKLRAAQSIAPGANQRLVFTAPGRGWYYLEAKIATAGFGPYTLTIKKTPSVAK